VPGACHCCWGRNRRRWASCGTIDGGGRPCWLDSAGAGRGPSLPASGPRSGDRRRRARAITAGAGTAGAGCVELLGGRSRQRRAWAFFHRRTGREAETAGGGWALFHRRSRCEGEAAGGGCVELLLGQVPPAAGVSRQPCRIGAGATCLRIWSPLRHGPCGVALRASGTARVPYRLRPPEKNRPPLWWPVLSLPLSPARRPRPPRGACAARDDPCSAPW
jgi:hypothetical protein